MSGEMTNTLTIEDEDGFTTSYPFPDESSILHQAAFVELCQMAHDQARREAGIS